jgi:hypothetical protein
MRLKRGFDLFSGKQQMLGVAVIDLDESTWLLFEKSRFWIYLLWVG